MSGHIYWLSAATSNYAVGNALAGALDPNSGGNRTFDLATKLFPIGTTFAPAPDIHSEPVPSTPHTKKLAGVPVREAAYLTALEFLSAGPYPRLNALGLDDATVAAWKPEMQIETGPRDEYEARVPAFIASLGCMVAP